MVRIHNIEIASVKCYLGQKWRELVSILAVGVIPFSADKLHGIKPGVFSLCNPFQIQQKHDSSNMIESVYDTIIILPIHIHALC